ncbi:MAG: DUF3102 domain-containing protein [Solibacillus sp.]
MANEVSTLSNDIHVITAEINAYQRIAGEAIFEIGKRLKHVKENDLVHGEWSKWCREEVGMDRAKADKFIRVFEEFGRNELTSTQRGLDALYQIATMPEEQRDQPHTIPSTGATKTVNEMTVRELREVKAELKKATEKVELTQGSRTDIIPDLEQSSGSNGTQVSRLLSVRLNVNIIRILEKYLKKRKKALYNL